jgi:hypothetical protein
MKKLFILLGLVATLTGCHSGKPYPLKPGETITTIRAEKERDEAATKAELQRQWQHLTQVNEAEVADVQADVRAGLICPEAGRDRLDTIQERNLARYWDLETQARKRLAAIDHRMTLKYAAWLDRK